MLWNILVCLDYFGFQSLSWKLCGSNPKSLKNINLCRNGKGTTIYHVAITGTTLK
jgi:hypothetical protein